MLPTTMVGIVAITFIVTAGATAILRPLVRQLGAYLDALTRQKVAAEAGSGAEALQRIEASLAAVREELGKAREEREFLAQLYPIASQSLPESGSRHSSEDAG